MGPSNEAHRPQLKNPCSREYKYFEVELLSTNTKMKALAIKMACSGSALKNICRGGTDHVLWHNYVTESTCVIEAYGDFGHEAATDFNRKRGHDYPSRIFTRLRKRGVCVFIYIFKRLVCFLSNPAGRFLLGSQLSEPLFKYSSPFENSLFGTPQLDITLPPPEKRTACYKTAEYGGAKKGKQTSRRNQRKRVGKEKGADVLSGMKISEQNTSIRSSFVYQLLKGFTRYFIKKP
ncbi:uncharacterized protein LOC144328012 isoform X1 [Podarcis muralis]